MRYLIILLCLCFLGFSYKTETNLSQRQKQNLHVIQQEINKQFPNVNGLQCFDKFMAIDSTKVLSNDDIKRITDIAAGITVPKTKKEKQDEFIASADIDNLSPQETKKLLKIIISRLGYDKGE